MNRAKTLFTLINELKEADWNYYAVAENNNPLSKPFVDEISAIEFLKAYFDKGGKRIITDRFNIDSFGIHRAEHTVSIFFLGILLFRNTILKDTIFYEETVNKKFDFFAFIWFLTCLAHDFAYYSEKREEATGLWERTPDINALIEQEDIEHNLLLQEVRNVPQDLFLQVEKYFSKRHEEGRTDHGILAGMIAYDILVKNRRFQKNAQNADWLWEDFLDAEYAYAASTIAIHNIWLPSKQDAGKYCEHGLGMLVDRKPITFSEGPLYYLLSIVDTLDPFKTYSTPNNPVSADFVLRNVKLKFLSEYRFELTVSPKLNPAALHKRGHEMKLFLDIDVQHLPKGIQVTISL